MKKKFQMNETFGSFVGSLLINMGMLFLFALILMGSPTKSAEALVEIEQLPVAEASAVKEEKAPGPEGDNQPAAGQVRAAKDFSFRPRAQEPAGGSDNPAKAGETGKGEGPATQPGGQGGSSGTEGTGSGSGTGTGQGSGSGSGSGSSGAGGSGTGGGGQHIDWRSRFVSRVENNKQYPLAARRRNITGTTQLQIAISPAGSLLSCSIVASSGNESLDQAALKAVRASVPFPHEAGGNLNLTLRVRFNVDG